MDRDVEASGTRMGSAREAGGKVCGKSNPLHNHLLGISTIQLLGMGLERLLSAKPEDRVRS